MSNPNSLVSHRANAVDASGIRKVFDLAAKMKNPINLSIGQPDFDVPADAKAAAVDAIMAGHNAYTQTQGIAPLRQRLQADMSREFGRDVGDVLIVSGVSGGLLLAILATLDPGQEAIFQDPYFVMYKHLLTMAGARSVIVDSYPDFRFHPDRIEKAITPSTRVLILNSPSNPTGVVMTADDVKAAVDIARRHNLLIISDEIYLPFMYESNIPSPASLYENTLVLRGFSKSHAMTGWRLGYAAGPAEVISAMTRLQQYTYVCAPAPLQEGALRSLDISMATYAAAYRKKRDLAVSILSRKFEIVGAQGAFYIFAPAPKGQTGTQFVARAIENNVLVIPGNVFSERDTHFRISFATTDDKLAEGCEILCKLA